MDRVSSSVSYSLSITVMVVTVVIIHYLITTWDSTLPVPVLCDLSSLPVLSTLQLKPSNHQKSLTWFVFVRLTYVCLSSSVVKTSSSCTRDMSWTFPSGLVTVPKDDTTPSLQSETHGIGSRDFPFWYISVQFQSLERGRSSIGVTRTSSVEGW